MKHILSYLILIAYFCISFTAPINVRAKTSFARIEQSTNIYKSPNINNKIDNIYCIAEESYFVEILDTLENLYRVNYNGVTGYINKSDVRLITNTPTTPYPCNIDIILGSNCNLRRTPTTQGANNIISTIYANTSDITFVGRSFGEEAIDFGGTTWYYVCYQGNYGYIYNNYVKSITPIYTSVEEFEYQTEQLSTTRNPITHTPSLIIIILLTIPLFITILLLYLPKKIKLHHKSKPKQKIKDNF
ncbi:MAG: hypothetical protein E7356_00885 [Clostridiales bacterium]|nr:hypothetical protein [Clostridiales bacterium]